jgi:hypothetical protein
LPVIDAWTLLEHVPPDECWDILVAAGVGRIGVIVGDAPEVYPLNFVVDGRSVVFRTDSGSKLLGLRRNPMVCLEVDGFDFEAHTGWSVLLKGRASEVTDAAELRVVEELPLHFWTAGQKSHWMRITPTEVTGRRLGTPKDEAPR